LLGEKHFFCSKTSGEKKKKLYLKNQEGSRRSVGRDRGGIHTNSQRIDVEVVPSFQQIRQPINDCLLFGDPSLGRGRGRSL
jgi:hypothetical protein